MRPAKSRRRARIGNAFVALGHGIAEGYPLCCVLHFSWDFLWHSLPLCGTWRGSVGRGDGQHVPCAFHAQQRDRRLKLQAKRLWEVLACWRDRNEGERQRHLYPHMDLCQRKG